MSELDPISYPTIRLGEKTYELKFRFPDIVRLHKEGLDVFQKVELQNGPVLLERIARMIAAGVSHQEQMSYEQVFDLCDFAELPNYSKAIAEALSKASAQAKAAKEAIQIQ